MPETLARVETTWPFTLVSGQFRHVRHERDRIERVQDPHTLAVVLVTD